jgi:hypothetical protein
VLLGIDSLRHRAAVAEILVLLSPEAKPMAVKIIEESSNYGARVGPGREAECQWELKDCIAVQKLLETTLDDGDAASSKLNISLMYNSWIPNYIMRYGRWSGCHQCTRVIFTSFAMT